jgi:predicted transcriptional regulator YdeE
MEVLNTSNTQNNEVPASSSTWKPYAVGGALLAMLAANGILFVRSSNLEHEVTKLRSNTSNEISSIRTAAATEVENTKKTIEQLNAELEQSKAQAQKYAAGQARASAERAAKKAEEMVNTLAAQQKAEQAKVVEAIGEVQKATESNIAKVGTKIGEVETEVGNVRTEVASTKSTLDSTIAELKSVRGDLGVQSGLIATNSKELSALRELGERNYYEFTLTKQNPAIKVANVVMKLRKADNKRNKFNMELVADDKRVEKKDKTVNEPVQFYVSGARLPYEVVINEVGKDKIVGYLATPKVMTARR